MPAQHQDPTAVHVRKGKRNFAWEDPDEHQPEEEFSLQQQSRFGQLNPSPAEQRAGSVFRQSILRRQLGTIQKNHVKPASPLCIRCLYEMAGENTGRQPGCPGPLGCRTLAGWDGICSAAGGEAGPLFQHPWL